MTPTPKRTLKARDIERLENTSFASVMPEGPAAPEALPFLDILADTEGNCSYSCPGECSCGCASWACCVTMECAETGSATCPPPETAVCNTGVYEIRLDAAENP